MNPKPIIACGLLPLVLLSGCPSSSRLPAREPTAPETSTSSAAALSAPAQAPARPITEGRLVNSGLIIESFARTFGRDGLQQAPSEVITAGVFRFVPYLSYEASSRYELNIYGDPQHPAGVEIGVYASKAETKEEIRALMAGMLQKATDRELVHGLALEQDLVELGGLTFVITPPTADDAFGGWWISIYDKQAIDTARASRAELAEISVPAPRPAPIPPSAPKKPKKPVDPREKSDRVYIEDYTQQDGAYVKPAL